MVNLHQPKMTVRYKRSSTGILDTSQMEIIVNRIVDISDHTFSDYRLQKSTPWTRHRG